MKNYLLLYFLYLFVSLFCVACSEPLNNPYTPELVQQKALLTAFTNRPKHFDPALAYDADSTLIIGQIYDSPLEYNYISILKQYDYVDGNTQFLNAEANVKFEIFYPNGTKYGEIMTDRNGYATLDIPYGVWKFHQVNSHTGFEKIYDFFITAGIIA